MTNKNKKTRQPERKTRYTDEERTNYVRLLQDLYPKIPHPLLMEYIKVHELREFGTESVREKVEKTLDAIAENPDLTYFGTNGFQQEIEENKGFKIVNNLEEISNKKE